MAEEAREHPTECQRLFEDGPVILFRWLPEKGWPVAFVSPGVAALGYDPGDLLSRKILFADMVHKDDLPRVEEEVRVHSASKAASFSQEYRIVNPAGGVHWIFDRTVVERDGAGEITAYVGYVMDVSDLRVSEIKGRELERLRDVVLDNLPGINVEFLDTGLRMRWASRSLAQSFGCSPQSVLGRTCHEVIHGSSQPCPECTALRALETGLPQTGEDRTGDGRVWWLSSTPVKDGQGNIEGVVHVATDVTAMAAAERALKDSEERLRLLVDNMPVLIHAHDETGRYIFWNKEAERVLGWSAEEIVGNPDSKRLLYPDDDYRVGVVAASHAHREFSGLELTAQCADGSRRTISWTNISRRLPIPGWPTWEIGVDVTERRALEERRKDVERILRHDLKRPMVQAVDLVSLLRETDGLDPRYAQHFEELEGAARRSLNMIDGYVRLQALESGKSAIRASRVDLDELVREVAHECAVLAAQRGVRIALAGRGGGLRLHGECMVLGDPALLWSLLMNLVNNALEASDPGGEVAMEVGRAEGEIQVRVQNAKAIPEEVRPFFFEKFATHGKAEGQGLGTFSARLIARAHGGDVTFQTGEDSGTVLTVHLPGLA